jgi:hypothetical protein
MFHLEDVLQLKDTEDVKLVARRHPMTLVPGLFIAMMCIVIPFFFLFPLFAFGMPGIAAFVVVVISGIVVAFRSFFLWDSDVLIVTTLRLIDVDQRGFFSRFVTEATLVSISDVAWRRHGITDTLFKIGTLTIQSSGNAKSLELKRVAHPERIHELLNDLRNSTSPKRVDLPVETRERFRKLLSDIEKLSPEAIDKVEQLVRSEGREEAVGLFLQKKDIE